jgi:hypothetical protein
MLMTILDAGLMVNQPGIRRIGGRVRQGAHSRLNPGIGVYASFNATSIANWPASVSQGIEIMGSPDG